MKIEHDTKLKQWNVIVLEMFILLVIG
jgi:hypothetical protein